MFRTRKSSGFWCRSKLCGMLFMLAGLIIMMIIVPKWAWAGIVCALMIVIGFLLWRYC